MKERIYIEGGDLVIRTSLTAKRSNPWDDDYEEDMDSILGVICGDEIGFAHWIDMSYKGKGDQISTMFYSTYMDKDEFKDLCKELGLYVEEYPICKYCHGPIYGCYTTGDLGDMCIDCEYTGKREKE